LGVINEIFTLSLKKKKLNKSAVLKPLKNFFFFLFFIEGSVVWPFGPFELVKGGIFSAMKREMHK
jgi:hypothetical protein